MTVSNITKTVSIELRLTWRIIPLTETLSAFRVTATPSEAQPLFGLGTITRQGVATNEAIEKAQCEALSHLTTLRVVCPPDEVAKHWNEEGLRLASSVDVSDHLFGADLFSMLEEDPSKAKNLMRYDAAAQMLFTLHDEVVPTAIPFSYIQGSICEGAYDLPKLVEALKQDHRVRPYPGQTLGITPIPSYNASCGSSLTVNFLFTPTFEEAQLLWAEQQRLCATYPSTVFHAAVFNLDLLKLRETGICKITTPYFDADED